MFPFISATVLLSILDHVISQEVIAVALLKPYTSSNSPSGNVTFTQRDDGTVSIKGIITGLKKNALGTFEHGFHIHEKGDLREGCISFGGHYNPQKKNHGGPEDEVRHIGDLGNIEAGPNGVAVIDFEDKIISLTGPYSILGRGVVLHSDKDDFGKGSFNDSAITGHAGSRIACGVIGLVSPIYSSSVQNIAQSSLIGLSLVLLNYLF